ncbi:hypothetical protein B7P43_G12321 [Cryptotermes secundus]|uniref:Uncharacterized protein n=1 Tax=Cryptotermes secundus TaxID=105785 RepID=A0A2J7RQ03_9NEOP|nr:hypothetical protein B7P43_G12321 [Cryptotermes secundus]
MQTNIDLMIESVINAQRGMLQLQIVAPSLILETLKRSIAEFPKEKMAPFVISKDSSNLIYKICDINIYVKDGILGYIISLPMINRGVFKTFRLIPLLVAMGRGKFIYIETESKLLYVDQTRQYYFMSDREELRRCKTIEPTKYICKQTRPLLNSHMQEACAINIPRICDTRIVQLMHTIWTQLEQRNEWIYFIPLSDSITILCPGRDPTDIVLTSTGKLMIQPNCKGYSLQECYPSKHYKIWR